MKNINDFDFFTYIMAKMSIFTCSFLLVITEYPAMALMRVLLGWVTSWEMLIFYLALGVLVPHRLPLPFSLFLLFK